MNEQSHGTPDTGDAFGLALTDRLDRRPVHAVVIERDDGLVEGEQADYFASPDEWDERDRWILDRAHGRVLDVGAGAGRAALAIQQRGHEVLALDVSPGAIDVCRRRGVARTLCGRIDDVQAADSAFDTFLFLGNNLGLLESRERGIVWLRTLACLGGPGAVIVGAGLDPYGTDDPVHLTYHEGNRQRGRMAGQITIRVRYRRLATEWFDLLWTSPDELEQLARAAGWRISEILPGGLYAVVLSQA